MCTSSNSPNRLCLHLMLTVIAGLFFISATWSEAQEQKKKAGPAKPLGPARDDNSPSEYPPLLDQWTNLNLEADKAYEKLSHAPKDQRNQAKDEYVDLVNKTIELLPKFRRAAMDAYQRSPNEDEQLAKLLVGMTANDVRHDRYKSAQETAKLLIENDCPVKVIYQLGGTAAYSLDEFATAEEYFNQAEGIDLLDDISKSLTEDLSTAQEAWKAEQEIRRKEDKADDLPRVKFTTNKGNIVLELFENEAPQSVANMIHLVEKGFYNGLTFHRVLPGFMAQGGCPDGDGSGGPGYNVYCECFQDNHRKHFRGSLSMAHRSEKNTGGSQFFLTFRRTAHLDGKHTVFGRVIEGLDILSEIRRRDSGATDRPANRLPEPDMIVKAEVVRKRDHEYTPTKVETTSDDSASNNSTSTESITEESQQEPAEPQTP